VLSFDDPDLVHKTEYCTVCFKNQKKGLKMDSRTYPRTKDPLLCPTRLAWAVRWVVADTLLCSLHLNGCTRPISQVFIKEFLRYVCQISTKSFGFAPSQIVIRRGNGFVLK